MDVRLILLCAFGVGLVASQIEDTRNFRDDRKCEGNFLAPNGEVAMCPAGCCSNNYCSNTQYACTYGTDYRGAILPVPKITGAPLNVQVQYLPATNLIYLSWELPDVNERNIFISNYKVEYYIGDKHWDVSTKERLTATNWPIKDPVAGTSYSYRVAASALTGTGPFTEWVTVETPNHIFRETEVHRSDDKCGEGFLAPNDKDAICPGLCCNRGNCFSCTGVYSLNYRDLDYLALENEMEELYPIANRPVPTTGPTPAPDTGSCQKLTTEFIFAVPSNYNTYHAYVQIASRVPVDVNVTIIGTSFLISTTVTDYELIPLPTWVFVMERGPASNKTVRVTATGVVTVHCLDKFSGGDGFRVFPTHQLGKKHRIASYVYSTASTVTRPGYISITAIDKPATVYVRNDNYYIDLDETINLKPYETYRVSVEYGTDLTGTIVESDQPVAVISGQGSTRIPDGGFPGYYSFDGVLEQNIPMKSWGRQFVLAPFRGKPSGYVYRILTGRENGATVDIQGRSRTISANSMYETETGETVLGISSDNPVTVIQYMKQSYADNGYGNSAMVINPPVETYVNDVTFSVFDYENYDSYLHVTIDCAYTDGLIFDEATSMFSWDKRESSDGKWCAVYNSVSTGAHRIRHSDIEVKFSVIVYGLRSRHYSSTAYIYTAGFQSISEISPESTSQTTSDVSVSDIQETFYRGQNITLSCRRKGDAELQQPVWRMANGATIFPTAQGGSDHINTICESSTSTKLTIVDAQLQDSGDYICASETSQEVVNINIDEGACEPLHIPVCEDLGYKYAFMPNFLNQTLQGDAELYLQTFTPLIQEDCSPDIIPFLCSMFAPQCFPEAQSPASPSREKCEAARSGCEDIMKPFGFSWPESLACENLPGQQDPTEAHVPVPAGVGSGSSTFIRWGQSDCPNNGELIYSGFSAGSHWNIAGSGSNFLCLHDDPEYDSPVAGLDDKNRARIDGVEFETSNFPPLSLSNNHDMVCAACLVTTRGAMIMIPARLTCPSGWTREYYGYLMSSRWDHKRTEFICVDRNPSRVSGQADEAGSVIYPVEGRCKDTDPSSFKGGLPCDKFPEGNELSCVVCTK